MPENEGDAVQDCLPENAEAGQGDVEYIAGVKTLEKVGMDGWSNDHLLEEGGELTRLQKNWVLKKTHVFPDTRGLGLIN